MMKVLVAALVFAALCLTYGAYSFAECSNCERAGGNACAGEEKACPNTQSFELCTTGIAEELNYVTEWTNSDTGYYTTTLGQTQCLKRYGCRLFITGTGKVCAPDPAIMTYTGSTVEDKGMTDRCPIVP